MDDADLCANLTGAVDLLRQRRPLVHCITNMVVQEITANMLLAAGATPAMVSDEQEAALFAPLADGLLVNIGSYTHQSEGLYRVAIKAAAGATPWVFDPVAVGALPPRTRFAGKLLTSEDLPKPTIIRGNASEIMALAGLGTGGRGVDAQHAVAAAQPAARALAQDTGAVVAVSGEVDMIIAGSSIITVSGGHPLMPQVIGTGCALGALCAAYAGLGGIDPLVAAVAAHAHSAAAGRLAGRDHPHSPGSFKVAWLDYLATLSAEQVLGQVSIKIQEGQ